MKKITILLFSFILWFPLFSEGQTNTFTTQVVGQSFYDLQTWRAMQNRLVAFDDNTFGLVWNKAEMWPGFSDMGIGYSFYNGDSWQPNPNNSITSVWATFPSYTAFGEMGELCFSQGPNGLVMSSRNLKGTGNWNETYTPGTNFKHPFVVTSGPDHSIIHLLYLDPDPGFSATPAQPFRGSIRYSRSTDGGTSWDIENMEFAGLDPSHYLGFTIGAYAWAQPRGANLAFVAGDFLTDLVLMKSTDGGDNWQKTVIWEHPYPFLELGTITTDSFYCDDGGISVALDFDGKAHVAFTLTRVFSSASQDTSYFEKGVGGVVYWNEDRPIFSNNINALNPYGNPNSELIEDYNLIGWCLDDNNNGTNDIIGNYGTYPTPGLCTMPQIIIDEGEGVIVTWSGVTENYNSDSTSLRHLLMRPSPDGGDTWGSFSDLNSDLAFVFSENVYPSVAADISPNEWFYTFQEDNQPGLSIGNPVFDENNIWFLPVESNIIPTPWVTAGFYAESTTINAGDTLQFINLSEGYPPDNISYVWHFEGGNPMISTETNPLVVYPQSGTFGVGLIATVNNNIVDSVFIENYIQVFPAIGISDADMNMDGWNIFPNPSSGKIRITGLNNKMNYQIQIMNLLGHEVMASSLKRDTDFSLVMDELPEGIYFMRIKNGEQSSVKKFILK